MKFILFILLGVVLLLILQAYLRGLADKKGDKVVRSTQNSDSRWSEELFISLTDQRIEPRGHLVELEPRLFRLDYYDVSEPDSHYEFLSKRGYQGGGPSWLGIIFGAIRMSDPEILQRIRFDEEGDGLAIWGSEKESLTQIMRLIAKVKSDDRLLLKAIQVAEEFGEME